MFHVNQEVVLDRLRIPVFAALIIGLLGVHTAGAQTATTITVVSGNGQVTCPLCVSPQRNPRIQPYIVKVADASGRPVANQEVDWTIFSLGISLDSLSQSTTFTDANGLTQNLAFENGQAGLSLSGYYQSQSVATLPTNGASVNFFHTQSATDVNNHSNALVGATQVSPGQFDPPINGVAGVTSTTPVKVHIDAYGVGVSNVSVRLLQENSTDTGTVACSTGPGADPGSVLTDTNGDANCYPVFGGKGAGSFAVLVGGVTADQVFLGTGLPIGFRQLFANQFVVTVPTPSAIQIVSGNNQSVNQGQAAARLLGKITDATGAAAIAGQKVTWSVSPVGAATLTNTVDTSDANGQIGTDVLIAASAVGPIKITATLNSSISATFNITAVSTVTLSSLQKVSGDAQSAVVNTAFAQPLIVKVNSTAGAAVGIPVQFSISGGATLSTQTATTDSAGQARVTVQAGATTGAVTVTASVTSLASVSFSLTIVPAGPNLTSGSFSNAAGARAASLSPCGLAIVTGAGLAPGVQGVLLASYPIGPNPLSFALPSSQAVRISVNNVAAPVFGVSNVNGQEQITFQIPCETTPAASVPVTVTVGPSTVNTTIAVTPAGPGIYETKNTDGVLRAVIVRPDGSFASIENPARKGEIVRTYVTGLGPVAPVEVTNALPTPGTDALVLGQVVVGVNNAGTRLIQARLAPNLIGVYEVTFQVPSDAPAGNDLVFSVGVNVSGDTQTRFSAGSKIPVL